LTTNDFENLLGELCARMTAECKAAELTTSPNRSKNRAREVIRDLIEQYKIPVDFSPHPFGFPDIMLASLGSR